MGIPAGISEKKNGFNSDVPSGSDKETKQVIKVNIGRIDVKADTQAIPPPKPKVVRTPKLSLSEYLNQRDEGER